MRLVAAAVLLAGWAASALAADAPLRVVPEVDFTRYQGRWYEIARLPNWFEKSCARDVTAEYTPRDDGRIAVVNRCRQSDGKMKSAEGIARRVEGKPPSVLKVRFAPAILSFIPQVWGDYQVIALAPDYSYAVIGTPDRKYLWVLARAPRLDPAVYGMLLDDARMQGFDVARLEMPPHGE